MALPDDLCFEEDAVSKRLTQVEQKLSEALSSIEKLSAAIDRLTDKLPHKPSGCLGPG